MIKGETKDYAEQSDIETLHLQVAWYKTRNEREYVSIGVVEEDAMGADGTISLQIVHLSKGEGICKMLQVNLLDKEIDMVIDGLQRAKVKRLDLEKDEGGK